MSTFCAGSLRVQVDLKELPTSPVSSKYPLLEGYELKPNIPYTSYLLIDLSNEGSKGIVEENRAVVQGKY